jgi:hypothetical protein
VAEPTDDETLYQRRKDINSLLDAVAHEKGLRECTVIEQYYKEQAQKTLSKLLRDVASLPDELVAFCQALLTPKPPSVVPNP